MYIPAANKPTCRQGFCYIYIYIYFCIIFFDILYLFFDVSQLSDRTIFFFVLFVEKKLFLQCLWFAGFMCNDMELTVVNLRQGMYTL